MSHQDTLQTCEDLLATLSAAETHLRVMSALQLDFSSVLKVYRDALRRSRDLVAPMSLDTGGLRFSELGTRDDTDEVLTIAVGGGRDDRAVTGSSQTTANAPRVPIVNAPPVPIDDGPEGTTDDSAPLATDEVSVETGRHTIFEVDLHEETEKSMAAAKVVKAEPTADDVMIMEEDDVAATEALSPAEALARASARAAVEDSKEPPTEESAELEFEDQEHTLVVSEERMPALPEDTTHPGPRIELPPEGELEEVSDQASADEVIVSKPHARVDTRTPAPAQGGQKTPTPQPAPGAVKPKVKAKHGVDKSKKDAATAKFYAASAAIPTIRDETTPKPRAAAVKLGAGGKPAEVLGGEDEDEPIAIEGVENEDELDHRGDGFTLEVEDHSDEWEDVEEEDHEEILELDSEHLEAIEEPEDHAQTFTRDQLKDTMDRARRAARQGNIESGVNFYSDVLDADPDNVEAYIGRGRLYLDVGDYARAMSDFTVAEDLDPKSPEPQVAVGDLYFARKDYKRAIDYFDHALEMKPDHAMAFCRRGISHYYRKNYKQALVDLNEAVRLDKDIPNIQTFVSMAKKKAKPAK